MRLNCPNYITIYNWNIDDILKSNLCNIIEWVYYEFEKIKKTSPVDILLERVTLSLPEESGKETIGDIINQLSNLKQSKQVIG